MDYRKGDRVLYNRQKFGTVYYGQSSPSEVYVVFDRDGSVALVRHDTLELVADAHHEAVLAALINSPSEPVENPLAAELTKLADELSTGADLEKNALRMRATMKSVSQRLRGIAKDL